MGSTIISNDGRFEWDDEKNRKNKQKHKIGFEDVVSVFDDPSFVTDYDGEHSSGIDERFMGIGILKGVLVVTIFFTFRGNRTRLISARKATSQEKEVYDEHISRFN